MDKSKLAINILIVSAILLIGTSIASVLMKGSVTITPIVPTPTEQTGVVSTTSKPTADTTSATTSTTTSTVTSTEVSTTTPADATSTSTLKQVGMIGKNWKLSKVTPENTIEKIDAFSITFTNDTAMVGTTDCNTFFGSYSTSSTEIHFSKIGSTKMFCENSKETVFLKFLENAKGYSLDKDSKVLTLTSKMGTSSVTMVFK